MRSAAHHPWSVRALALTTALSSLLLAAPITEVSASYDAVSEPGFRVPQAIPYNAQYDVMNITNRFRRAYSIPNVYRSSLLSRAAMKHAADMAARRVMSHTGSDGSNAGQRISREGFYWGIWGENVAAGQTSAEQVMRNWMWSPSHRSIILDRRFRYIGVGVAQARDGVLYWCLVMVGR